MLQLRGWYLRTMFRLFLFLPEGATDQMHLQEIRQLKNIQSTGPSSLQKLMMLLKRSKLKISRKFPMDVFPWFYPGSCFASLSLYSSSLLEFILLGAFIFWGRLWKHGGRQTPAETPAYSVYFEFHSFRLLCINSLLI